MIVQQLAGGNLMMKLKIVEADGIDVIINAMTYHVENSSVLSEAFQALSHLSVDKQSRNFIAQQGGVMIIASSMESQMNSVEVQVGGLAALCSLASDVEEGILHAAGIISAVKDSMANYPNNSEVQRNGLALLNNLSIRGAQMRIKLLSSSCLATIKTAVEMHISIPKIVSSALNTLVTLSDIEGFKGTIFDGEVVKLTIYAMMINAGDLRCSIAGCKYLHAFSKSYNEINICFNGVEAVVYAMMCHPSSEFVQDIGCRILASSSEHSFTSDTGDFDPGMFLLIHFLIFTDLIVLSPTAVFFHLRRSDAFDFLCKMVEVILAAMSGFPDKFSVQNNSIVALTRFMEKAEDNITVLFTLEQPVRTALSSATASFPKLESKCRKVLNALVTT